MADTQTERARPTDPVGRALHFCSYILVLAGGFLMSGLTVMTVVSVTGRKLFNSPIQGDYELVTIGTAIAVFLFLPYCHLQRGNVVVDLFLSWAPKRVQTLFDALSGLLLAAIAGGFGWRMALGGQDMHRYNDVSYILALPTWPVFAIAAPALVLLSACGLYTAVRDFKAASR
jgi:TRAP-type C4-dicarboxylate transport system permease small subunit